MARNLHTLGRFECLLMQPTEALNAQITSKRGGEGEGSREIETAKKPHCLLCSVLTAFSG